jgi:hypothetical protein
MNLSRPFIRRPIASSLIAVAILLMGVLAYGLLPVSPLPQVDFPTIRVSASLPGANPDTMAASVRQSAGLDQHHVGIRARSRHQRRSARCAGGDQRSPRTVALGHARQPDF